jgi:hypothetical protein
MLFSEDWSCSRLDQGFPYTVNNNERLGDPSTGNFPESSSGAMVSDVLSKHVTNKMGKWVIRITGKEKIADLRKMNVNIFLTSIQLKCYSSSSIERFL